jgi:hypothetical protein
MNEEERERLIKAYSFDEERERLIKAYSFDLKICTQYHYQFIPKEKEVGKIFNYYPTTGKLTYQRTDLDWSKPESLGVFLDVEDALEKALDESYA